jgi:uncharacterized membrane protein YeaQ/YmgE (transglycosylase-associated protein family)
LHPGNSGHVSDHVVLACLDFRPQTRSKIPCWKKAIAGRVSAVVGTECAAIRGPRCRDREADERTALAALNAAIAIPVTPTVAISAADPRTIMAIEALIIWLVIGAVAGWLAGLLVKGYGFGLIGNILVGIAGAIIVVTLRAKKTQKFALRSTLRPNQISFSHSLGHGLPLRLRRHHDRCTSDSCRFVATPRSAKSGHKGTLRLQFIDDTHFACRQLPCAHRPNARIPP